MKLSNYHKHLGDEVFFKEPCSPDKVYVSCIFEKNRAGALGSVLLFNCPVEVGGSGISLVTTLPPEVEHDMPDYDLYGTDYSLGFTSRGCIRSCPFCIVPKKEGPIRNNASISEFLDSRHEKVILLDNNFLASPRWKENLKFLRENGLKVNFNQGLDIRLVDEENASLLAETDYWNKSFKCRFLHFAWDLMDYESEVRKGIKVLNNAGIKGRNLMFYMLCGFNTSFRQDLYRFKVLRDLGVDPFVMVYNNRRDLPIIRHFARWVNKRVYKKCTWGEYDYGKAQEVIKDWSGSEGSP